MSLAAVTTALASLLATDATFTAALQTLLGVATPPPVLRSNQPLGSLNQAEMPCWVMEPGDGEAAALSDASDAIFVIGNTSMGMAVDIEFALVWDEQDRETAAAARIAIGDLLARLLLRHPTLNNSASGALLTEFSPDRGGNHPLQIFRARVRATYQLSAS